MCCIVYHSCADNLYSVPLCEQFLSMAGGLNLGFVGSFAYFLNWSQFSCVGLVFLSSFCFSGGGVFSGCCLSVPVPSSASLS